ncbi:hypothetical protein VM1G_11293 [Cytospora mali]|uniref:Uncharacterized protein n=1 Tax=Cytospora mali TaxID=578113 RepID=A0A194VL32_CYTMA|nr:hypothetical protein VM1G_11293 [Valsa mali]
MAARGETTGHMPMDEGRASSELSQVPKTHGPAAASPPDLTVPGYTGPSFTASIFIKHFPGVPGAWAKSEASLKLRNLLTMFFKTKGPAVKANTDARGESPSPPGPNI